MIYDHEQLDLLPTIWIVNLWITISMGTHVHMFLGIHCNTQISLFLYMKIIFIGALYKKLKQAPKNQKLQNQCYLPTFLPRFQPHSCELNT